MSYEPNKDDFYNNEEIGAGPFLTMHIDPCVHQGFTQENIDRNLTACVISDNNTAGKGIQGQKLFGKVVWVSPDLVPGTERPVSCAIQARGVARFKYSPVIPEFNDIPKVNGMVECHGDGTVQSVTAHDEDESLLLLLSSGHLCRGQVIAVYTENKTCDVWLG